MDFGIAAMGLAVGFVVGLTGMGGGALMTPLLVLAFHVQPLAAVSSDLVAAVVMKPVGGSVHLKRGTVNLGLVKWLALGSVPSAFLGVLILRSLGSGDVIQGRIKTLLGVALLVAAGAMVAKASFDRGREPATEPVRVRPLATVAIGVAGGLIVGMTSVGSGSLMIVLLLVLYPQLTARQLVGTDLVQAIPLVISAAVGHLLFGDFALGLTASLLIGSVPGVYFGARVSAQANDRVIRPVLVTVLAASALKLLNVPTAVVGVLLLVALAAGAVALLTRRRRGPAIENHVVARPADRQSDAAEPGGLAARNP
ncbi:MAG: sulfite exporter TauE/SafE family protein [Actinomycetota bacterium]|nr:sulfite exporter TauE/SafE family protein [Actinomycetota bacterium]